MDWLLFAIFLAGCVSAASTGAIFMPDDWYRDLAKPVWTPPDWVFPLTWMVLYLCIAVAAMRVAMAGGSAHALGLWAVQMVLNGLWSPIFFGKRRIRAALVAVGALWCAVAVTMVAFFQIDTFAGVLFVPYLLWVSIAASLNFWIWRHNDDTYAQQPAR
ncbi:MAG: TspO/MBR family protein [Pseudomonadota bacterium]